MKTEQKMKEAGERSWCGLRKPEDGPADTCTVCGELEEFENIPRIARLNGAVVCFECYSKYLINSSYAQSLWQFLRFVNRFVWATNVTRGNIAPTAESSSHVGLYCELQRGGRGERNDPESA